MKILVNIIAVALTCLSPLAMAELKVGAGSYDITGPAAELGMLGYGKLSQVDSGIHQRLRARAFVIEGANGKRIVFINTDLPMVTQSIHQGVVKQIRAEYSSRLYSENNIMISATHTHSGPGGYSFDPLYNITTAGFNKQNYDVIVSGIMEAIRRADNNLTSGHIYYGETELTDASKNRSIEAYQNNHEQDINNHAYPFDVTMQLFKFMDLNDKAIAMLNWFPLHGVSMSNRNHLISGDNKGYAAYLFEKDFHTDYTNKKAFVAGFAQGNEGDVSPNIHQIEDDPNANDIGRTEEEGMKQYFAAKKAFLTAAELVGDEVDYRFAYVDMPHEVVQPRYTEQLSPVKTCDAALGYAFAAGTSDGRGEALFKEGDLKHLPYIDAVTSIIAKPTPELTDCQTPKPILVATGLTKPIAWTENILPVQLFKIGRFVIAGVPGEFTTTAGRLLKKTLAESFPEGTEFIISGLSNAYSGYITTPKEYEMQHYEGGHTLFGPNTLPAYLQEFARLANDMAHGYQTRQGKMPVDISGYQFSLKPGVLFDDKPLGKSFGQISHDVRHNYQPGERVQAVFWGAHPNNHLMTGQSYLAVEKKVDHKWQAVAYDWDWSTTYQWERIGVAYSKNTITWDIPKDITSGEYRLHLFGHSKNVLARITPFEGKSSTFTIHNKINHEVT